MNNKFLLILLFFFSMVWSRLQAQGTMACQPGITWTLNCQVSCINCDLDNLSGRNTTLFGGGDQYCHGDIVTENARWYGFIAGTPNLILGIAPTNCMNGDGLEFVLFDGCPNPNSIVNHEVVCMPGPNPPAGFGFVLIMPPPLVVGRNYLLMIDGFNGDECDYTIRVLQGSTIPPPLGPISPINGPADVCPNGTATYSVSPVQYALNYTWVAPPGSSINNGGSVMTLPASSGTSVDIQFGSNSGNVCVSASSPCNTPVVSCLPVHNGPIPPTLLDDATVCYSELPYQWPEEPFTFLAAPGTYNLTSTPYVSSLGCDSIVKQKITVLPPLITNLGTKYLCKNECFNINGIDYCEPGNYQEAIPNVAGCDSLLLFNLVRVPAKAIAAPADTITCAVTSVPLSGNGSTTGPSVTYRWLNPQGQQISTAITATADGPGTYKFIVTNALGGVTCMDTALVNVPGNLTPPLADAGPDMVLTCQTTQVQLQGTGSTGSNYTYFWKPFFGGNIVSGATTLTPIVNMAGTYSLRVTNSINGCTAVSNAVVTSQITSPNVTAGGGTTTCSAPNVTLQVSTDAPNPGFAWSGPNGFVSTQQNPSVSAPGDYVVVVTNGITSCTATATATVIAGADVPDASASGGTLTCTADSITLTGTSNYPGVNYQWTGPNGFSSSLQNPKVDAVGNYQLAVTAPNGCSNTAVAVVTQNNTAPGTSLNVSGDLNCNNASVNLLATNTGGNAADLVHIWTLPGGGTQNTGSDAFLSVNAPGAYQVLVTNSVNGCTSVASSNVVQYSNVTAAIDKAENTKCAGSTDGSLSAISGGGNGTYTYSWSNGPTTSFNGNLGPGTYILTVSDGQGCTATVSGSITSPTAVNANASATDQTSNGSSDGTATASPSGGTPGYTYSWSTTASTQSISGLLPGSYTVTVTDANGCTDIETVNVSPFNCLLSTGIASTDVTCFGAANGTASTDVQGGTNPISFEWSNGATTSNVTGLGAGLISVTITDAANCQEVQTVTILEPGALSANATSTNTTGPGLNDGTASANPTGGTGAYSYNWSNSQTTASITGLAPGFYTVTVTDGNDCQSVQTVEVTGSSCLLTNDFQVSNPTCNGQANGSATVLITGGTGAFTYQWSSGGSTQTVNALGAGTYTVTATDAAGCSIVASTQLTAPPALTLNLDSSQPTSCANLAEGSATVSTGGGTGALSVSWSDGQVGKTASGLVAGTYTAVVEDANGCTNSLEVVIGTNDNVPPTITAGDATLPIGQNGNVVLNITNMNVAAADNCNLATVVFQPVEFSCLELGPHFVTITATDNAGNSTSQNVTVMVVDDSPPTLICSPSLVNCFEDNPVSYQAPTATDNCLINGGTFNITAGLPIGALFPLGSTTTTYTFTDAQGNTGSCSFEVTILSPLVLEVDTVLNDVNNQHIGGIFINPGGSLPPYTYSWTQNGQQISTQQNLTGVGAGDYSVVVTDDNGCTVASQTITVTNTSGTNSPVNLDDIRIFPNPTSGQLTILLPDDLVAEKMFIRIFDQTGRRVLDVTSAQQKQVDLNLFNLSDGLYSLVARIGNNQIVRNVVVTR